MVNSYDRECKINELVFVDDTALMADPEEKFCQLVQEFGRVCRRRNLRVKENGVVWCGVCKVMKWKG